jgi:hypothetical protein
MGSGVLQLGWIAANNDIPRGMMSDFSRLSHRAHFRFAQAARKNPNPEQVFDGLDRMILLLPPSNQSNRFCGNDFFQKSERKNIQMIKK